MTNLYRIYKHYHYTEMFDIAAETVEQAIEILEFDHDGDPDDLFKDFDFYNSEIIEENIQVIKEEQ